MVVRDDDFLKHRREMTGYINESKSGVSSIGDSFGKLGGKIKTAFAGFTAAALLAGLTRIGNKLFEISTAVEETQSKFDTTFGQSSEQVDEFIESFANMAGLTRQQAQETAATMGAIAQGFGLAQDASADFSQDVLKLAADLASFNNVRIEDTLRAIQSGLVGEIEPLRRFGISLNAAEVEMRALAMSGKRSKEALTDQDRVVARLALAYQKAGVQVGDLARTQDSTVNQARRTRAEYQELINEFSTGLKPAYDEVINAASRLLQIHGEEAGMIGRTLANAVVGATQYIVDYAVATGRAAQSVLALVNAIGLVSGEGGLGMFTAILDRMLGGLKAFSALMTGAAVAWHELRAAALDTLAVLDRRLGMNEQASATEALADAARAEAERLEEGLKAQRHADAQLEIQREQRLKDIEEFNKKLEQANQQVNTVVTGGSTGGAAAQAARSAFEKIRRSLELAATATDEQRAALQKVFELQDRINELKEAAVSLSGKEREKADELIAASESELQAAQQKLRYQTEYAAMVDVLTDNLNKISGAGFELIPQDKMQAAQDALTTFNAEVTKLRNQFGAGQITEAQYFEKMGAASQDFMGDLKDLYETWEALGLLTPKLEEWFNSAFDSASQGLTEMQRVAYQTEQDLLAMVDAIPEDLRVQLAGIDIPDDVVSGLAFDLQEVVFGLQEKIKPLMVRLQSEQNPEEQAKIRAQVALLVKSAQDELKKRMEALVNALRAKGVSEAVIAQVQAVVTALTDEIAEGMEQAGGATDGATGKVLKLGDALQSVSSSVRAVTRLSDAFGGLSDNARKALDGIADILDNAGQLANMADQAGGLKDLFSSTAGTLAGVSSMAGIASGMISTIASLIQSGKAQEEARKQQSERLRELSIEVQDNIRALNRNTEALLKEGVVGAGVSQAQIGLVNNLLSQLEKAAPSGWGLGHFQSDISREQATALIDALENSGVEMFEGVREIFESSFKQALEFFGDEGTAVWSAIRAVIEATGMDWFDLQKEIGQFGKSLEGLAREIDVRKNRLGEGLGSLRDVILDRLGDGVDIPETLDAWLDEQLSGIDLDTEEGQKALEAALDELARILVGESEKFSLEELENLSFSSVEELIAILEQLRDTTEQANESFKDFLSESLDKTSFQQRYQDRLGLTDEDITKRLLDDVLEKGGSTPADARLQQAFVEAVKGGKEGIDAFIDALLRAIDAGNIEEMFGLTAEEAERLAAQLISLNDAVEEAARTFADVADAFSDAQRFAKDLGLDAGDLQDVLVKELSSIAPELAKRIAGFDLSTQAGRDALRAFLQELMSIVAFSDEGAFGLTEDGLERLIDWGQSLLTMSGDDIQTSRSVQYVRTVTEATGNEMVLLLRAIEYWVKGIYDRIKVPEFKVPANLQYAVDAAQMAAVPTVSSSTISNVSTTNYGAPTYNINVTANGTPKQVAQEVAVELERLTRERERRQFRLR